MLGISSNFRCICDECHQTAKQSRVEFSRPILNLGLLPTGLNIKKELLVRSLSGGPVEWFIVEMKYNIDNPPYVNVLSKPNVNCDKGMICCSDETLTIVYEISTEVIMFNKIYKYIFLIN